MKRFLVILFSFMLLLPVQTAFAQVNNVPKPPINTPSKPASKPNPRPANRPSTRPSTRPSNKPHNRPRTTTSSSKTSIDVSFSCNVYDEPVAIMIDGKLTGDIDSVFTLTTGNHKVLVTADGYAPYSTSIKVDETDDGDFFYFELTEATADNMASFDLPISIVTPETSEPEEKEFIAPALPPESVQPEVSVLVEDPVNAQRYLNDTITVNGVSFIMVFVPGGTYTRYKIPEDLSSVIDINTSSVPHAHRVSLSNYYIGMHEVTWDLWFAVMSDSIVDYYKSRPYDDVTWVDCHRFIDKLNKLTGMNFRLPTDAEWEYAARGGNKSNDYVYSGSNDINEVAWYNGNYGGEWHEVGTKAPNELGIYDMTGGACEWCEDWYNWPDANENTPPLVNPKGPMEEQKSMNGNPLGRVVRGGSYGQEADQCCVFQIYYGNPQRARYGLRLAL